MEEVVLLFSLTKHGPTLYHWPTFLSAFRPRLPFSGSRTPPDRLAGDIAITRT